MFSTINLVEVKTTIERCQRKRIVKREHYFRVRWLSFPVSFCGLRISEVIGNTMGAFFVRRDAEGEERWWLEITGKGDKIISSRHRRTDGRIGALSMETLSPFPLPGEPTPSSCRSEVNNALTRRCIDRHRGFRERRCAFANAVLSSNA